MRKGARKFQLLNGNATGQPGRNKIKLRVLLNLMDPFVLASGTEHAVLQPKHVCKQFAVNQNKMWDIIKMLSELLLEQPAGKYVIMNDPDKHTYGLVSVRGRV